MKRLSCLSLILVGCLSFATGCNRAPEVKPVVTAPEADRMTPDATAITQDPKLTPRGPDVARTMAQVFDLLDKDKSSTIDEEELREAYLTCTRWFPADRQFVENLYENRSKHGHILESRVLLPVNPQDEPKVGATVHRYGVSKDEFSVAWEKLRGAEAQIENKSDVR